MPRPLLLGHRGARAVRTVPENSLASFDLALDHGCDGFECDVRMTADRKAVICHDPVWHPPASQLRFRRGMQVASTSRNELSLLPSLDEVIERYRATAFLDVELKVSGIEEIVVHALKASLTRPGLVVSSFLPDALLAVHRVDSTLPLGLICENQKQLKRWPDLPVSFVIPNHRMLTPELLDELHSQAKQVMVWTVNDVPSMRRLAAMGVDGIISDETQLLVQVLGGTNAATER
jgi:glycerophosphoryl diester phosphodiesterase